MGMTKPIVLEIAHRTYAINEFGMATCFIMWGTKRGLMIDTGCGMYNVKEIADELCPYPYDVVLTHGHGDHSGYMDAWDEVWLHPADWDAYAPEKMAAAREFHKSYPKMMAGYGSFEAYDITEEQLHFPDHAPKFIPCEDGTVFDLGDRKIDVIHTPGHTAGEIVLIDPTTRILFSGDACNPNLGLRATSINTALKGLLKVKAREKDFDRNFNSHIGYGGSNVHIAMPDSCLDDCLYILEGIMEGTADVKHASSPFRPGTPPVYYVKYGNVQITFDPNRIIDEGEENAVWQ